MFDTLVWPGHGVAAQHDEVAIEALNKYAIGDNTFSTFLSSTLGVATQHPTRHWASRSPHDLCFQCPHVEAGRHETLSTSL